jgi:hypothetical protein
MKQFITFPIVFILCLTLGLAPFTPEPHIWEKLKRIVHGSYGMNAIDWLDLLVHGLPWVLLLVLILQRLTKK